MTIAIIGTGGIGSAIARQLASGGETLRLSSADEQSARRLAAVIGEAAVVAVDNCDALQGADAVVCCRRVVAADGALGYGVRKHVGRSLRILKQPVTGPGGPLLRDRR
jgi:predicted dinucleotide-binding enzyme